MLKHFPLRSSLKSSGNYLLSSTLEQDKEKNVQNEDAPQLYPVCYEVPGGSIRKAMSDE